MNPVFTASGGQVFHRGNPVHEQAARDWLGALDIVARSEFVATGKHDARALDLGAQLIAARVRADQQRRGRPSC